MRFRCLSLAALSLATLTASALAAKGHEPSFRSLPPGRLPEGGVAGQGCGGVTLTQSANPGLIQGDASVFCGSPAGSAEFWVARSFGPMPAATAIGCIEFGIDENAGAAWPVEVHVMVGTLDGPDALATVVTSSRLIPAGAQGELFTLELAPIPIPAGANLVVALRSPSRIVAEGGDGGVLVFGFNSAGQSGPTYLKAPTCNASDFVTAASVGFPGSHAVMTLGLAPGGGVCGAPGDCFRSRSTPGCQVPLCCSTVCAVDPACCDVAWDSACVDLATQGCGATLIQGQMFVPSVPGTLIEVEKGVAVFRPSNGAWWTFGVTMDSFDLAEDASGAPKGLGTPALQWSSLDVGAEVKFTFTGGVGGGTDTIVFETVAQRVNRLHFEGGPNSCFAASGQGLVDIEVYADGAYVGAIDAVASGELLVETLRGPDGPGGAGKFTWFGLCKGTKKTTTTTNPDGSTTTTTETTWKYCLGGSNSGTSDGTGTSFVVHAGGGAGGLIGDTILVVPTDRAMCAPPTSISVDGKGPINIGSVSGGAGAGKPIFSKVVVGTAEVAPVETTPGTTRTELGVDVGPITADTVLSIRPTAVDELVGVQLTGFSSDLDGVRLDLGGAEAATFEMALETEPGTVGGSMVVAALLEDGSSGGAVAIDRCIGCPPPFKGTWNVVPDFAGLGAGTYTLVALNKGEVVAAAPGLSGPAGSTNEPPAAFGKLGGATPCYVIKYKPPIIFLPPFGDGPIVIDELRILAEGAPPQPPIDAIEVRGSGLASLLIGNPEVTLPEPARCVGDLNGDAVVNAADLAILLGAWGTGGSDLDGDGVVTAADLAVLLGAWGDCP